MNLFGSKPKPVIPAPGSLTWPFRLGDRVRDKVNKLEGIAVDRAYHLTGCDRFAVEPDAHDGKQGETFAVDGNRLELVLSQPEFHRDELPDRTVQLGDEVRCPITKLTGIATVILIPLHGAMRIGVDTGFDPKKKVMGDCVTVDEHMLEVTKPYTPEPTIAEPAPSPSAAEKPRGHMRMPTPRKVISRP